MFVHEERPFCDDPLPPKPQLKVFSYCSPEWTEVAGGTQRRDAVKLDSGADCSAPQIRASLQDSELWGKFRKIGTEMVITKSGRRMFPCCKVSVMGLNPKGKYILLMDVVPSDDNKYKWNKDRWEVNGMAEPHLPNRFFIHPDSPALGDKWMQYPVSFHKLKLTNNTLSNNSLVVLHSMHKYVPRLHILQNLDPSVLSRGSYAQFTFPEAAFVAVTAYQNTEITKLKIDHNPFAKGFRDHGLNNKRYRGQGSRDTCKRALKDEPQVTSKGPAVPSEASTADGCRRKSSAVSNPFISAFMSAGLSDTTGSPAHPFEGLKHPNAHVALNCRPYVWHPTPGQCFPELTGSDSFPQFCQDVFTQSSRPGESHPCPASPPGAVQTPRQPLMLDCHLPLPPNIRRVQLAESALSSLEAASAPNPGGPHLLAEILNRVRGSPPKQAQAVWPPLSVMRDTSALANQPHRDQTSECRTLEELLGHQSGLVAGGLVGLRVQPAIPDFSYP